MRIWNLTPHTMHYDDGIVPREMRSDGVLRLEQVDEPAEVVAGLKTVTTKYAAIRGLPEGIQAGDVLLVSTLIGDYWKSKSRPAGVIVLVPDTGSSCKRDEQGRIVSVAQFIRK